MTPFACSGATTNTSNESKTVNAVSNLSLSWGSCSRRRRKLAPFIWAPDRYQHGRQHDAGNNVMRQPRRVILAQRQQPRRPAEIKSDMFSYRSGSCLAIIIALVLTSAKAMSALPPKADIARTSGHVRLVPKADSRAATNFGDSLSGIAHSRSALRHLLPCGEPSLNHPHHGRRIFERL